MRTGIGTPRSRTKQISELTGHIIAAAMEVHRILGPGFEEVIYQRALAKEMPAHGLEFERAVSMDVTYR